MSRQNPETKAPLVPAAQNKKAVRKRQIAKCLTLAFFVRTAAPKYQGTRTNVPNAGGILLPYVVLLAALLAIQPSLKGAALPAVIPLQRLPERQRTKKILMKINMPPRLCLFGFIS